MSIVDSINNLLADPAPELAIEVTSEGLAVSAGGGAPRWIPYEAETLRISPVEENILRTDSFLKAIREAAGPTADRKRTSTVVILPDFTARMAVLEFEQFPDDPEEQRALVRFRMKKTVPFDVDAAAVSFYVQPRPGSRYVDVLATLVSMEILAKYEAPFRAANLWPGRITTSTLSAMDLVPVSGCRVLIKVAHHVLTVAVAMEGKLRLLRCVELSSAEDEEIGQVLYPTLAYLEDELKTRPQSVHLCGLKSLPLDLDLPEGPLVSPYGTPNPNNAGLLGYLASGGRN